MNSFKDHTWFDVEYEILPAVFDPEEAAKSEAPPLYPGGNVYGPQFGIMIEKGVNEPVVMEWGDIEEGFKIADVVIEDKVEVKPQIHSPIEPHSALPPGKEMNSHSGRQPNLHTKFG